MKKLFIKYNVKLSAEDWVWFFIWFTLPISIRLNSLAIIVGGIVLLVSFFKNRSGIKGKPTIHLLIPSLFFVLHASGIANEINGIQSIKELEQMLPLIIIPVYFLLSATSKKMFTNVSFTALVISLSVASTIMLGYSVFQVFFQNAGMGSFVYHDLIKPFNSGAIYFSFFIVVVLLQFDEISWLIAKPRLMYAILFLLLLMLFLSASKLMIGVGIPLLVVKFRDTIINLFKRRKMLIPVAVIIVVLISIPFMLRFNQIVNPELEIVKAERFNYDSPLNGLNLRLIQARFGIEIIEENNALLNGIGINRAQDLLNSKYIEYGIYTGYSGTDDTGYLNYNFHNQFIETFVRSGLAGLLVLLAMIIRIFAIPGSNKFVSNGVLLLVFMFFLTESVLERQQGIVYFCLIYSSYFNKHRNTTTLYEL